MPSNPACVNASATASLSLPATPTQDPNSPVEQFGNEGRNVVQGPGYSNWDFSALKNIHVTEGKEFQFRAELFNFWNHTNLGLPNSDISSPTFGSIHSDLGPRVIQ